MAVMNTINEHPIDKALSKLARELGHSIALLSEKHTISFSRLT